MPDDQKSKTTDGELTRVLLLRELERRGQELLAADRRDTGSGYVDYSNDVRAGRDVEAEKARRSRPGYRPGGRERQDINLPYEKQLTGAALEKRKRELADEEARYERKRAADNVGERGRVERWGR